MPKKTTKKPKSKDKDTIWPSDVFTGTPDPDDTFAFLRGQAQEVTELSDSLLKAELRLIPLGETYLAGYFNVRAPVLGDYTVRLFSVSSCGLPTVLSSDQDEDHADIKVETFEEFKEAVVAIMEAPNMKRLLRNLIEQSKGPRRHQR